MHRVVTLSEEEFIEEHIYDICPPQNSTFKFAMHTINIADDVIVVDGLRRIFNPLQQIITLFYNLLNIKTLD